MNNSVFGKTMENLRKRIYVRLFDNAGEFKKYVSKPSFVSQRIFNKNLVATHEIKPVLTLTKPVYVGLSIIGLTKLLMYEFHYKYIKSKYSANLLFKDIDSLVYEIETEDVYEVLIKTKISDYPQDSIELHSKFFDPVNKKVIGKMKDEFKGKIINEFAELKSKMNSLIAVNSEEVKKVKRANENVVKNIRQKIY